MNKILRLLISTFGAAGATFLLQMLLARHLSIGDYGSYASVNSLIVIVAPFACAGIGAYFLRRGSVEPALIRELYASSFLALLFTSSVAIGFATLVVGVGEVSGILVFCFATMFWGIAAQTFMSTQAQLAGKPLTLAISQSVLPVFRLSLAFTLSLAMTMTIGNVAVTLLVANILATFLYGFVSLKSFGAFEPSNAQRSLTMIWKSFPYSINGSINVAQIQLGVAFAAVVFGAPAAALFATVVTLINAIYILPNTIFGLYLLPRYHRMKMAEEWKKPILHALYSFLAGAAIAIIISLCSLFLINLLFGEKYAAAAGVLSLSLWAVPFRFFSTAIGAAILTEKLVPYKVVFSALALALQFFLFWKFSTLGIDVAAYSVIASEVFVAAGYMAIYVYRIKSQEV